jgi:secondary thiamine-phosphate synthase enzyme
MIRSFEFTRNGTSDTDIFDLTDDVQDALSKSGVRDGLVTVFTPGSTAAVTTIEFESGVLKDLARAIERLAPRNERYAHDAAWGDGNGYAHVRSALVGPSCTIPVSGGKLVLGTWQQIVLLDFDNRPRKRRVAVHVMGEGK